MKQASTYAIIQLAGKQFKVTPDQTLTIDRQPLAVGESMEITSVLLSSDGETTTVGTPTIKNAKVTLKVTEHTRGEKIRVATYKSKSRYRKVRGHRQDQTVVTVSKIAL